MDLCMGSKADEPINVVYHKNASITIVLGAMVMLLLFSSCSGKKKELGDAITAVSYTHLDVYKRQPLPNVTLWR